MWNERAFLWWWIIAIILYRERKCKFRTETVLKLCYILLFLGEQANKRIFYGNLKSEIAAGELSSILENPLQHLDTGGRETEKVFCKKKTAPP